MVKALRPVMDKIDIKNLTGKCLVSQPDTPGEFAGAVVYICVHGSDGAMGFIINRRVKDFSFQDLAAELPFAVHSDIIAPISLYHGGPLDQAKGFILHSGDYHIPGSLDTGGGIMISSSLDVLRDIAVGGGPKQRLIALGYAGWAPNQLEAEIANNLWLVADATPDLVLGTDDDDKWKKALSSLGISDLNLTPSVGHS